MVSKIVKAILLFSILFSAQATFCQENYTSGYIVLLKGDTMRGFIDYRNWEKNPNKVIFKENLNGKASNFTPLSIKAFGVQDEIYKSAIIKMEISSNNINELSTNRELELQTDTLFLQTLVQGVKSLYVCKTKFGKDQFYINSQTEAYELLASKRYLNNKDGKTVIGENKKYLGQLIIYLSECSTLQSQLNEVKYSRKSLEKLFSYYYECTQSRKTFQKKEEKMHFQLGVMGGFCLTKIKVKSAFFTYLNDANYSSSSSFTAGFYLNILLPRNQGKWSIKNELLFSSYKTTGTYTKYYNDERYTNYFTTLGYSYLKMNNLVHFRYPINTLSVFFNAGISNGYAVSETNYQIQEIKLYAPIVTKEEKGLEEIRKHEQGFIIGFGTKLKKFSSEIRYEIGNGMSAYLTLNTKVSRYCLLVGYEF